MAFPSAAGVFPFVHPSSWSSFGFLSTSRSLPPTLGTCNDGFFFLENFFFSLAVLPSRKMVSKHLKGAWEGVWGTPRLRCPCANQLSDGQGSREASQGVSVHCHLGSLAFRCLLYPLFPRVNQCLMGQRCHLQLTPSAVLGFSDIAVPVWFSTPLDWGLVLPVVELITRVFWSFCMWLQLPAL